MTADALFDAPPPRFDRGAEWTVREVAVTTFRRWLEDWHYTHALPLAPIGYGVFAPDMIACVTLSPATNLAGVAGRLGLERWPGNIEISRVVAHPDAPYGAASRAVAACYGLWNRSRGLEWVFSYADTGQRHHGGIYQALNAVYCGVSPARPGFLVNGVPKHPRSVVADYGSQAWPAVIELAAAKGDTIERVPDANTPKHTYVLPIGGPASRRAIRAALAPHSQPYPKRGDQLDAFGVIPGEVD